MIPYFLLMLVPFTYYFFASKGSFSIESQRGTRKATVTVVLFFLIFLLMLSLRDISCGIDLKNYLYFFNRDASLPLQSIFSTDNSEMLFSVFNVGVARVFKDFRIYLILIAAISVIPFIFLYSSEVDLPYQAVVLFVVFAPFSVFFSGLRQIMALSFAPILFELCKKKKLVPFLLVVLIASGFHQSALIMLLMYPVFRAKFTKRWLLFVIPLIVLVLVFNKQLYSLIVPLMGSRYKERYSEVTSTGAYTTIIVLFIFSFYSIFLTEETEISEEDNGIRNLLFLCTALQCFAPVNAIAMRMNYYYLVFVPIAVPRMIVRSQKRFWNISYFFSIGLTIAFFAYFFFNAYRGADILNIFPYVPLWSG